MGASSQDDVHGSQISTRLVRPDDSFVEAQQSAVSPKLRLHWPFHICASISYYGLDLYALIFKTINQSIKRVAEIEKLCLAILALMYCRSRTQSSS